MSDCPPYPLRQTFTAMPPSLPCMLGLGCHLSIHSKYQVRANTAIPETWTSMTPTRRTMSIRLAISAWFLGQMGAQSKYQMDPLGQGWHHLTRYLPRICHGAVLPQAMTPANFHPFRN